LRLNITRMVKSSVNGLIRGDELRQVPLFAFGPKKQESSQHSAADLLEGSRRDANTET
jgi:hypothetical protein